MDVRLVLENGKQRKKTLRLHSEETIIGRRQDCDLRIKSAEVSRRHCLLSFHDGCLRVEDLDSVNGTFVNGTRVTGKLVVRPGDRLEIGRIRFIVEYEMSQDILDRLADEEEGGEELEVLPVAEEGDADAFAFSGSKDQLDELPFADEDTEYRLPQPADAEEEAIPVLDDLEGGDWHLPQAGDLRDLLSQMDDPKHKHRPVEE
jgi:pSer/pThr/pTyr-binding forkhead associated (FHA) protein